MSLNDLMMTPDFWAWTIVTLFTYLGISLVLIIAKHRRMLRQSRKDILALIEKITPLHEHAATIRTDPLGVISLNEHTQLIKRAKRMVLYIDTYYIPSPVASDEAKDIVVALCKTKQWLTDPNNIAPIEELNRRQRARGFMHH